MGESPFFVNNFDFLLIKFGMASVLICVCLLLGTFVGVGFVSGKEVWAFFMRFGVAGFVCGFVALFILSALIFIELKSGNKNNKSINNQENVAIKTLDKIIGVAFVACEFVVMVAMIAGVFSLNADLKFGGIVVPVVVIIACFLLSVKGVDWLGAVNLVFIPLVLVVIISMSFGKSFGGFTQLNSGLVAPVALMLMYVGMNALTILPVLKLIKNKLNTTAQKIMCCVVFFICSGIIYFLIGRMVGVNGGSELPLVLVADECGGAVGLIYRCLLLVGLSTTFIAEAIAISGSVVLNKDKFINTAIIFYVAIVCSLFGFNKIVEVGYPAIGCAGLVLLIIKYLLCAIKKLQKFNKNNKKH